MLGRARSSVVMAALVLVTLVAAAVVGQPVAAQAPSGDPIVIGVLAPFNTPAGDGILNAADMATNDINAAGGILGRPIKMVAANTEYNPQKAASSYQKLVLSDRAVAVIGSPSSGESLAIQEQMARYRVPFLNTGAAASSLTEKVLDDYNRYKYYFRVMHDSPEQGIAALEYVTEYLAPVKGIRKVAILSENAVWTQEIIDLWETAIAQHPDLELVATELFDVQTNDYNPNFQRIMNAGAELIMEISSNVDAAGYTKQWADLQAPPMGGVSASAMSSRIWNDTGGRVAYEWTVNFGYRVPFTDKTLDWYDRYVETYGVTPDYTTGYTYDAFFILKEAIEGLGRVGNSDELVVALEATDYTGVIGRWVFTESHHSRYGEGYRIIPIVQWLPDGSRQILWPPNLAEGEIVFPPWSGRD